MTASGPLPRWLWLDAPVGAALMLTAIALFTDWQGPWLYSERGLLELGQFAILVLAVGYGARVAFALRAKRALAAWYALATLGALFTAGEEVSWGQHLTGFGTPEWLAAINDQGETNLHNVTSWLDQKPRAVLELGIVVGGIVLPLLALVRPALAAARWWVVVPPLQLLPTAALVELARLGSGTWRDWGLGSDPVLFFRASEVQETFFFWFVLIYLIAAYRRLHRPIARA
jgi:hypothetical protein